ncbi:MAG TPA: energy-coupling factor transporter ATPase [Candidatus Aphodovivens avistercoris]|nr:energy-coupling factor transporter ATPase [Candidatus Aphodovivens avistercoris]
MPLAFEGVSYSYDDPKGRKKKRAHRSAQTEPAAAATGGARRWALHEVSFTLEDGEFLGLAGHTGSGKSTLIQHANGLLHPTEGRVLFDGRDLADKQAAQECRSAVGLVFQYPEHQLFAATVREDVAFGPRNLGLPEDEVAARVSEALALVHLDEADVAERSPFELSGGQQRRVAFAGVLAMRPRVLVLDEPVAGLDPVAREEFLALIGELHRTGLSLMMASHSMEDLARLADRILVLAGGEMLRLGTPEEVFSDGEGLRAVGLDVPAAQRFAEQLRAEGFRLPRALYDVESLAADIAAELGAGASAAEPAAAAAGPATSQQEGHHA